MIQTQIKLRLTKRQERVLNHWLWHLSSVWNWTIRKIEQDANGGVFYTSFGLRALVSGHGKRMAVPQDALNGTIATAHIAWQRCFRGSGRKPKLKGRRNKLNSIAFAHGTVVFKERVLIPTLGRVRFYKQQIPTGRIGQMRIVKRASGWYLCLFIQSEPKAIPATGDQAIGIDPGFNSLLTLSNGEKVEHPQEFLTASGRLAQVQRGRGKRLTARLQEHVQNQRKDRNHKLSRRLVSENQLVVFSADHHHSVAKKFGKSVSDSAHYQLRRMLAYKSKCRTDGLGVYVEVPSKNSTRTCSSCGVLSGPTGLAGLKVRQWRCVACGAEHDRDVNAAVNTLIAGIGAIHEMSVRAA